MQLYGLWVSIAVYAKSYLESTKRTRDLLSPLGRILDVDLARHNGLDVVENLVEVGERGERHILSLTVGNQLCKTLISILNIISKGQETSLRFPALANSRSVSLAADKSDTPSPA